MKHGKLLTLALGVLLAVWIASPRDGIAARAQTVVRHTANAGADFARTPGQLRHEGYIAGGDKKTKVDSFARINFFL
ncbi:MAG: hypothetical protein J6C59_00765 [Muribaculaceae bacterium]|nr:hypothetical protein [Muribaculaceae bacterium]